MSNVSRNRRIAAGLCARCGKNSPGDFIHCEECRKIYKEKSRRRRSNGKCAKCGKESEKYRCDSCSKKRKDKQTELRKAGLCVNCGNPSKDFFCENCKIRINKNKANLRKKRKLKNLCVNCGEPSNNNKQYCEQCRLQLNQREKALRDQRKAQGLCSRCGEHKPCNGRIHCIACGVKQASEKVKVRPEQLYDLFEKQNGICPYFKIPISLGSNAELDHFVPRSKGGKDELANFQWIHEDANVMKNNMSHEEFVVYLDNLLDQITTARKFSNYTSDAEHF